MLALQMQSFVLLKDYLGMHLQETKGECGQENQSAIQWQLKLEDIADREQQHNDIRNDVEGTGDAEDQYAIAAFSLK